MNTPSNQLSAEYEGFLILYSEYNNLWVPKRSSGELSGCVSLAKAKESIDKLSKQEKSTFIRHKAIFMASSYDKPQQVEVTSFVVKTDGYSDRKPVLYAWIKTGERRQCEKITTLREFTAGNVELFHRLKELEMEAEKLRIEMNDIRSKLTFYALKPAKEYYSSAGVPVDIAALLPK